VVSCVDVDLEVGIHSEERVMVNLGLERKGVDGAATGRGASSGPGVDPRGPCSRTVSRKSPGPQPTLLQEGNIRPLRVVSQSLVRQGADAEVQEPSQM
jgi:hypothetical protein